MLNRQLRVPRRGHQAKSFSIIGHHSKRARPRKGQQRAGKFSAGDIVEFAGILLRGDGRRPCSADQSNSFSYKRYQGGLVRKQHLLRSTREETLTQETKRPPYWRQRANDSKPKGDHIVFAHFPEHPKCEECRKTKTTRATCTNKLLKRVNEIPPPTTFGGLIIATHKKLNFYEESRDDRENTLIVQH